MNRIVGRCDCVLERDRYLTAADTPGVIAFPPGFVLVYVCLFVCLFVVCLSVCLSVCLPVLLVRLMKKLRANFI